MAIITTWRGVSGPSYQSNCDNLAPRGTKTVSIPDYSTCEPTGEAYGLVPNASLNNMHFYR